MSKVRSKVRKRAAKKGINVNKLLLVEFIIIALIIMVVGIEVLEVPVFAVGAFMVLEAFLVTCLFKTPIYVHGIACLAQIAVGVWTGHLVFVLLMVIIYICGLIMLNVWLRE